LSDREVSRGAVGWITFAGIVMIIGGGFAMLEGFGMVLNSDNFAIQDSVISQSASNWGWFHMLVGLVVALSGFAVFSGNVLARTVGVIAATISALGAFATIEIQPFWNIVIIIIDIAIIWALTVHGRDVQKMQEMGM
jgi:hypothetical protein